MFFKKSYSVLATTEFLYSEIYKDSPESPFFIFFLYLAKIAVDVHAIKFVKNLLKDEYLEREFKFDEGIS